MDGQVEGKRGRRPNGASVRSVDPRAVESRRRLRAAFVELARDGVEMSVTTVIERAGVNRSSFYAHFVGLDDLALFTMNEALELIHQRNLERQSASRTAGFRSNMSVIEEIIAAVTPPSPLTAALGHDRAVVEQGLGERLRDRVLDYYANVVAYSGIAPASRAVSAEYVGHALSAVLCGWLTNELELPADELALRLGSLVPDWVMAPEHVVSRSVTGP